MDFSFSGWEVPATILAAGIVSMGSVLVPKIITKHEKERDFKAFYRGKLEELASTAKDASFEAMINSGEIVRIFENLSEEMERPSPETFSTPHAAKVVMLIDFHFPDMEHHSKELAKIQNEFNTAVFAMMFNKKEGFSQDKKLLIYSFATRFFKAYQDVYVTACKEAKNYQPTAK